MENQRKSYYSVIPAPVRYDKTLTELEKLLYGEITSLSNEKGYCTASNAYFAKIYSKDSKTISRSINNLKARNYITLELDIKQFNNVKRKIFLNVAKLNQISMDIHGDTP